MSDPNHFRVLVVDDNPGIHDDFRKILMHNQVEDDLDDLEAKMFGATEAPSSVVPEYEVSCAHQGLEAVSMVEEAVDNNRPFSLAFVDMRMPPGINGVETISRLWEKAPDLQTIICTAHSDYSWNEIVEKLGWSDRLLILKKPFDRVEVLQMALSLSVKYQLEQLARLKTDDLRAMVAQRTIELDKEIERREQVEAILRENPNQIFDNGEVDATTGLLNRAAILDRIRFIANDSDEHGAFYSILSIDIDKLSDVNSMHGELVGDIVLKNVALRLRETLRPNDVIGRYGGEEFLIGLRNCASEDAILVGERLRQRVAHSSVVVDGLELFMTVSVGIATQDPAINAAAEQVMRCADKALITAKNNGRNRVEVLSLV